MIVVDDGLTTGRSALAAVRSLRERGAKRVILAVPVAAPQRPPRCAARRRGRARGGRPPTCGPSADRYEDFRPTSTDEEVSTLLAEYGETPSRATRAQRLNAHPPGDPVAHRSPFPSLRTFR